MPITCGLPFREISNSVYFCPAAIGAEHYRAGRALGWLDGQVLLNSSFPSLRSKDLDPFFVLQPQESPDFPSEAWRAKARIGPGGRSQMHEGRNFGPSFFASPLVVFCSGVALAFPFTFFRRRGKEGGRSTWHLFLPSLVGFHRYPLGGVWGVWGGGGPTPTPHPPQPRGGWGGRFCWGGGGVTLYLFRLEVIWGGGGWGFLFEYGGGGGFMCWVVGGCVGGGFFFFWGGGGGLGVGLLVLVVGSLGGGGWAPVQSSPSGTMPC